jgi:allantoinase
LQFLLPAFYTKAVQHHFSLTDVARLLSENTTKLIGMSHRKGKLVKGYDADIVVWNPEKKFIVEEKDIRHKHKITPYLHEELQGVVKHTFVGGELVYSQNEFKKLGAGELLMRTE